MLCVMRCSGAEQLPENMRVHNGRRVLASCLHIVLLWMAVQALIIAEGVQRASHIDMQMESLSGLANLGAAERWSSDSDCRPAERQ